MSTGPYVNPVININGTSPSLKQGNFADIGTGVTPGDLYLSIDTQELYRWTGSAWAIAIAGTVGSPDLETVLLAGNTTTQDIVVNTPGNIYISDGILSLSSTDVVNIPLIQLFDYARGKSILLKAPDTTTNQIQTFQLGTGTIALTNNFELGAWQSITWSTGWTAVASFRNGYRKDALNRVYFEICAKVGTLAFATVLPAGYRPAVNVGCYLTYLNGGSFKTGWCYIDTTGVVNCQNASGSNLTAGDEVTINTMFFTD